MTDWPLEINGDEYHPIPESWIENGHDDGTGSPRVYATTVAHRGRHRIVVRYLHPTQPHVLKATMEATDADDGGMIPALLGRVGGRWPRSVVPQPHQDPDDVTRRGEREHMRSLWAGRIEAVDGQEPDLVADGGRALGAITDIRQRHLSDSGGDRR